MTTYLSRVRLNPTRRATRMFVASPQVLHAAVMQSHFGATSTSEGRVLWRLDSATSARLELFVVSPSRPDFTGLIEQVGWPTTGTWDTTEYDRFLGKLTGGQQWSFALTANPVRALATGGGRGSRGRVSPNVTVDQQHEWLEQRCAGWGFRILPTAGGSSVVVSDRVTDSFRRRPDDQGAGQGRVSITRCDFAGALEVTDAQLLRRSLVGGMGRAKAYGCGLMTLARL